jgi:peptide/nickel transport system ATP-binding protein
MAAMTDADVMEDEAGSVGSDATDEDSADVLVRVRDLKKHFPVKGSLSDALMRRGQHQVVRAVDGVDFDIRAGEVFGLAGESGSGKSTLGRTIIGLLDATEGSVVFDGVDLGGLSRRDLRRMRRHMQVIFQDPLASLNPRMTLGAAIEHPARIHRPDLSASQRKARVMEMLEAVGLTPPSQFYDKYPHQLSGGQRQRIVIARALITEPSLIVADEPVAMADVSVRAVLLDLMMKVKDEFGLTYLFITHDLATAKYVCDRIAIMYLGQIVELGDVEHVYRHPQHPYTEALLDAAPVPDPTRRRQKPLPSGEIPNPIDPPAGCPFHPRCPVALGLGGACDTLRPPMRPVAADRGHVAACHVRTGDYVPGSATTS